MNWLLHADIVSLVQAYGYVGIGCIVGLESIGLPFPGEITLVGAAVYAGTKRKRRSGVGRAVWGRRVYAWR